MHTCLLGLVLRARNTQYVTTHSNDLSAPPSLPGSYMVRTLVLLLIVLVASATKTELDKRLSKLEASVHKLTAPRTQAEKDFLKESPNGVYNEGKQTCAECLNAARKKGGLTQVSDISSIRTKECEDFCDQGALTGEGMQGPRRGGETEIQTCHQCLLKKAAKGSTLPEANEQCEPFCNKGHTLGMGAATTADTSDDTDVLV